MYFSKNIEYFIHRFTPRTEFNIIYKDCHSHPCRPLQANPQMLDCIENQRKQHAICWHALFSPLSLLVQHYLYASYFLLIIINKILFILFYI